VYIPSDSTVVSLPTSLHDTVFSENTKYLFQKVIVHDGKATVVCATDSLQAVIAKLTVKLQTLEKIHDQSTTIKTTVHITTNHIPKWVWWLITINIAYLAYKFWPSYSGILGTGVSAIVALCKRKV